MRVEAGDCNQESRRVPVARPSMKHRTAVATRNLLQHGGVLPAGWRSDAILAPGSPRAARPSSLRHPNEPELSPGTSTALVGCAEPCLPSARCRRGADHQPVREGASHDRTNDACEFLVELISQLFPADVLISEQAERIEALESQVGRLRGALARTITGAAA